MLCIDCDTQELGLMQVPPVLLLESDEPTVFGPSCTASSRCRY